MACEGVKLSSQSGHRLNTHLLVVRSFDVVRDWSGAFPPHVEHHRTSPFHWPREPDAFLQLNLGLFSIDKCRVLGSAKMPLLLSWQNRSPLSEYHLPTYEIIFKNGDGEFRRLSIYLSKTGPFTLFIGGFGRNSGGILRCSVVE